VAQDAARAPATAVNCLWQLRSIPTGHQQPIRADASLCCGSTALIQPRSLTTPATRNSCNAQTRRAGHLHITSSHKKMGPLPSGLTSNSALSLAKRLGPAGDTADRPRLLCAREKARCKDARSYVPSRPQDEAQSCACHTGPAWSSSQRTRSLSAHKAYLQFPKPGQAGLAQLAAAAPLSLAQAAQPLHPRTLKPTGNLQEALAARAVRPGARQQRLPLRAPDLRFPLRLHALAHLQGSAKAQRHAHAAAFPAGLASAIRPLTRSAATQTQGACPRPGLPQRMQGALAHAGSMCTRRMDVRAGLHLRVQGLCVRAGLYPCMRAHDHTRDAHARRTTSAHAGRLSTCREHSVGNKGYVASRPVRLYIARSQP
jgi:hypothetical protein